MNAIIREYRAEDKAELIKLMHELQMYLYEIDSLKIIRKPDDRFAPDYVEALLRTVGGKYGRIFVADLEEKLVGMVAGILDDEKAEVSCAVPMKSGKTIELVVSEHFRGQLIGKRLMEHMEDCFRSVGCTHAWVDAFSPNSPARRFYERLQYTEELIKYFKTL